MTKKFDVIIGNPPYQEDAVGDRTSFTPIYHEFMDAAYELGKKAILITPARFLFNAGFTPRAWNTKMLNDPHFSVELYSPDSESLFPGTDIKGGVVVTLRDEERKQDPVGVFVVYKELRSILRKVKHELARMGSLDTIFARNYRHTKNLHQDYPEIVTILSKGHENDVETHVFARLPFIYHEDHPTDGDNYTHIFGLVRNRRVDRWVRSDYISGPDSLHTFKVGIPAANGSGEFGETLSSPLVLGPGSAVTRSFITIGTFEKRRTAEACLKYVKSKFVRALLSVLKITQHNKGRVWKYVPLQDFTADSDIDWRKSIPEIDQQLYAKYGLSAEEIEFIETHVKPMD